MRCRLCRYMWEAFMRCRLCRYMSSRMCRYMWGINDIIVGCLGI